MYATPEQERAYRRVYSKRRRASPETWAKQTCANIKSRAKRKGIPFDMSYVDIIPPAICPALGVPIILGAAPHNFNSPSVDRVRPELGYVKGNVRVISWRANAIKHDASADDLRAVLLYVERCYAGE